MALWHFETDFDLKIKQDSKNFKGLISTEMTEMRVLTAESFTEFDKQFMKFKQHHTLVGVSVSSSQLSIFTGEQLGMKVQSMWMRDCRKKFYFYYGMTIAKFRATCVDMQNSRGYKVHDVAMYLNEKQEVQVAAVWHNADPVVKISMPLTQKKLSPLELLIYQ